ncbi:MAG: hypothetical protein M3P33_02775, partial [bacterium]|nr:hypothetical protein [bacterium]
MASEKDSGLERQLNTRFVSFSNIPTVCVPKMDVVGSHAGNYEGRTSCNRGILVIARQKPAEALANRIFRPNSTIVEVGPHQNNCYDILRRLEDNNGDVRVDGVPVIGAGNKVDFIGSLIRRKGIKVMATHEQDERLWKLAAEWGVSYLEDHRLFEVVSTKSGFNMMLDQYKSRNPDTLIHSLGRVFENVEQLIDEVERLVSFGESAYIKFDFAPGGQVNCGGEGQLCVSSNLYRDDRIREIYKFIGEGGYDLTNLRGVVQLAIPSPTILSMSSGQNELGEYEVYEAHVQLQDGNTASGAMPLSRSEYSDYLLNYLWPEMARFYRDVGVVGRQNLNYICIPPGMLDKARLIYGNPNLPPIIPIDLNYRAIAGTINAMARWEEETERRIDMARFQSKSIKVHASYAANPHLMYELARNNGMLAG